MLNRILLVQPQNTLQQNIYPPLNLIQIGSALRSCGFDIKIITCPTEQDPITMVLEELDDVLFVGIGILTPEVPHAVSIARAIKDNFNIPIVWGGWHTTLFSGQMARSNLVDKIIVGEGDEAIINLARYLQQDKYVRGDGCNKIIQNKQKLNMDLLPFPDYLLVPNIEFYINTLLADKFLEYEKRKIRWLPYQGSRGCPGQCTFCINVVTENRKWRCKSAEKVINEIERISQQFRLNHVKIIDDNFFVNTKWVSEIAKGLIENKLDITWDAECRADYINDNKVNDNLLELCVRSGLNELNFGLESGSLSTLARMKKGVAPEQNYCAVKKVSEHGIVSRCSFILDIPGDTKEDILETISLVNDIRALPKTTCGVHTYRPYPKSELCENLLKHGIIEQPSTFEGWAEEKYVAQFAYIDAERAWQSNYQLSGKVSFYQNLESGFWLRPHQIRNKWVRILNSFFMKIACLRNRKLFFHFCVDRLLYNIFKRLFFRLCQRKDKQLI